MAATRDVLSAALRQTIETAIQQLAALDALASDCHDGAEAASSDPGDEVSQRTASLAHASQQVYSIAVDTICACARRHNDKLPRINSIPLELLCASFAQLSYRDRITITHVCKWWRQIALEHATLWNRVVTSEPEHLATMLQRSQTAPLHIDILAASSPDNPNMHNASSFFRALVTQDETHGQDTVVSDELFTLLSPHMPRVRTLRIRNLVGGAALKALLSLPAPELRRFSLGYAFSNSVLHESPQSDDLFSASAPQLRHLAVTRMPLRLSANILRGLTYLEFSGSMEDIRGDMLDVVNRIPEVVLHWFPSLAMYMTGMPPPGGGLGGGFGVFGQSIAQAIATGGRDIMQFFLPPSVIRLRELIVTEDQVRAVHADTGFVRDIRNAVLDEMLPRLQEAITESAMTLTVLTISEPAWRHIGLDVIPAVVELTIMLRERLLLTNGPGPLDEYHSVPQLPSLRKLRLDYSQGASRALLFHTLPPLHDEGNASFSIPASTLAKFIKRTGARPALTLRRIEVTYQGEHDTARRALLEAVESVHSDDE